MGTEIAVVATATCLPAELIDLIERATDFAKAAKAESTRRAYAKD